jgi:type IV secretory pathway VirJ component
MKRLRLLLTTIVLLTLAACGTPSTTESPTTAPPTPTPRVTPIVEPTAPPEPTSAPTAAPAATVEPTATPDSRVPIATLTAELSATVVASLPPTSTPMPGNTAFPGIEGVSAQLLKAPESWPPLWAVSSYGLSVDPAQGHFVAIYTHDDGGWKELDRFTNY